jgi:hypothetical protein
MMDSRIKIGSVVEIVNPGDWRISIGTNMTVEKVFRWGVRCQYFDKSQLKEYYAQWQEIEEIMETEKDEFFSFFF